MLEPTGPNSCKMMQPGLLITEGGSRHQPIAIPPPLISTTVTHSPTVSSKRRTEYLDPCQIAPLKKRKIQVGTGCSSLSHCHIVCESAVLWQVLNPTDSLVHFL